MRFDELFVHEQKVRRTSFVIKILVCVVSCLCLVTFSLAAETETHSERLALAWITFGTQVIVSGSFFIGHIINELTPKLTVVHSIRGIALFLASGACSIATYTERSPTSAAWEQEGLSALLATGIFSFLIAVIQALDVFFAIKLHRNHPSSPTPTWSLR